MLSRVRHLEFSYDAEADAANLKLGAPDLWEGYGDRLPRTVSVGLEDDRGMINLEFDREGRLVGLEVIGARALLRSELLTDD
jgi:uncharacterized protein YuzE